MLCVCVWVGGGGRTEHLNAIGHSSPVGLELLRRRHLPHSHHRRQLCELRVVPSTYDDRAVLRPGTAATTQP